MWIKNALIFFSLFAGNRILFIVKMQENTKHKTYNKQRAQ